MEQIVGRNPVIEALRAGRTLNKIVIAKGVTGSVKEIVALAREQKIPVQEVDRAYIEKVAQGLNHQGVVAMASAKEYVELDDILSAAEQKGEAPFILILDEIEDPHNLGAILRTAEAAGVHGVVIPKRRAVGLNATVAKASAGAIEYVPVARVNNLVQTIEELKGKGCWIAGADGDAPEVFWQSNLKGSIAVVIGSEGKGLGRLIKEKCDFLIRLPMKGQIGSLNASVAASLIVYEVLRQRGMA